MYATNRIANTRLSAIVEPADCCLCVGQGRTAYLYHTIVDVDFIPMINYASITSSAEGASRGVR